MLLSRGQKNKVFAASILRIPTKNAFCGLSRSRMEILSGYELFLYQGIHAFQLFTGRNVDAVALRRMLAMPPT